MKLSEIIQDIKPLNVTGDTSVEVNGIHIDSRKIAEGYLFVAMKGTQVDGHQYIDKAIAQGACAVLLEDMPANPSPEITYIQVESTEEAVGPVATAFYGNPSKKLKLVGVTGTNGKTTIATLLYNMFRKFGHKCGLLSTVCNYIDGEAVPASHTTPDAIELNALLARMVDAGCEYAFMECSSHAIQQRRIGGLSFAGGIFTNLTRDHLDYHKTFENYRDAKKLFFDTLPKNAFAIINVDDKNGMFMVQNCKAQLQFGPRGWPEYRRELEGEARRCLSDSLVMYATSEGNKSNHVSHRFWKQDRHSIQNLCAQSVFFGWDF
jgi:UDP-N-acetylmuramoyl-L-alanyl-D-glutamate--2,6-diaminopimelate ligase